MAGPIMEIREAEMRAFWKKRMNSGEIPEPEHAYVPVEEQYITDRVSTSKQYDPENFWRELFGKHRCIACGKPFRKQEDAFDCHPEASAWIVWQRFAFGGSCGGRSLEDAIRVGCSSSYR